MYALVTIAGKQYKAATGARLTVDKLAAEPGTSIDFSSVHVVSDDNGVQVGTPFVAGAKVVATVESHVQGDKVVIYKYKRRKDYRRRTGHRQRYTTVVVDEVVVG